MVADFLGGAITSDAGALLLGASDRAIGAGRSVCILLRRCPRAPELIEHQVATLVGQRVFGIALGYEDVSDHDQLRHDPVAAGAREQGFDGAAFGLRRTAGGEESTLNRLELSRSEPTRYHKIGHDGAAIERLLVDIFVEAHRTAPKQIILDLDATDDPVHGHQEEGSSTAITIATATCRFTTSSAAGAWWRPGCAAPTSTPRPGPVDEVARIVAQVRARWPRVRILLRADSGFAREALMAWCEDNKVDYLFGLARNARLEAEIAAELAEAAAESRTTGRPARRFRDFMCGPRSTAGAARRRVIGKERNAQGANPTRASSSPASSRKAAEARYLYERVWLRSG